MAYVLAVFLTLAQAPTLPLNSLIDGVGRTFAQMKDFSADFVQIEQNPLNRKQQASGHLYLARPRKMRMEYKEPEDQLDVSNGKTFYSYIPADRQIREEQVKDSLDDRIPLMLVVGRADLRAEFKEFQELSQKPLIEGTRVVRMIPKRKMDYSEFLIEVDPQAFQVRRFLVTHSDGSRSDFVFSNIRINTGLKDSLFEWVPLPGIPIIKGSGS